MTSGFVPCECCLYGSAPQYKITIGSVMNGTGCSSCSSLGGKDYIVDFVSKGCLYTAPLAVCGYTVISLSMYYDTTADQADFIAGVEAGTQITNWKGFPDDCLQDSVTMTEFIGDTLCSWPGTITVQPVPPSADTDPRDWHCCIPIQLGCAPGSTVVTNDPCKHIKSEFGASLVCCQHTDADCGTAKGACCQCGDEDFPSSEVTLGAECSDLEDVQCYICYSSSGNASPCGGK